MYTLRTVNDVTEWKPRETSQKTYRPIHLYLIFEKSSLQNQVRRTGFLTCENQFRNGFLQATQAVKIQFVELDFSNLIFQKSSTDG